MKNTIAIIALVQNLSAIQLKDQFVSLAQDSHITELGILGAYSGGNQEGGSDEADELGVPKEHDEDTSFKDVETGAPPPGFAAFMKKKADDAAAAKAAMHAEKMKKLLAMRAAQ